MKVRSDLRNEVLNNLRLKTGININAEGSVAVAIADALIDEIMLLYRELERIQSEAYLTTSSGNYTALIAELFNKQKQATETDSEFKLRVANSVYTAARGNLIAIEEAIWSVPGVASFRIDKYTQGTGSFSVFVFPQRNANQQLILDRVYSAVRPVVSEGIRFDVRIPEEERIDLSIVLQFSGSISVMERQNIRNNVRSRLTGYLNSMAEGSNLYINEIIELIMGTNKDIIDLGITSLKLNGTSRPISNIFPDKGTRFVAGTIDIV